MSENTLFGAPLSFTPGGRDDWIRTITQHWSAQMGHRPRSLAADLDYLAPLFATGVAPKTVRERVYALPPANPDAHELPPTVALIIDGCALVTPEGRILLDVLHQLQQAGSTRIEPDQQIRALATSSALRAHWHTVWLLKQFHGTLSPSVLGAALFLLINGSVGEERALRVSGDERYDRELGNLILPLIATFSESLGGKTPDTASGIRRHWAFTQVTRYLGRHVNRTGKDGTSIYIRPGHDRALLDEIGQRLEQITDSHRLRQATLQLVASYRDTRGVLAALGQMHEDPTATRRILSRLAEAGAGP